MQTETESPPASFEWTNERERCAMLLGLGHLTELEIARQLGIHRNSIWHWKKQEAFRERVSEYRDQITESILAQGIALKSVRMEALNERHKELCQVIEQRAGMGDPHSSWYVPGAENVPGIFTGLVTPTVRCVGTGETAREVVEWDIDFGMLKALLAIEEQAAREMGHRRDNKTVTVLTKAYIGIDTDKV